MDAVFSLVVYTFLQQMRNRLYLVVVLFGVLMVSASLLFGAIAADQEVRAMIDLGLATAEIFGIALSVFGAVTLVLEEMESRTIYLILTRPLPRPLYILGRFLGLLASVLASVALMELIHFSLLWLKGWNTDVHVVAALVLMAVKISIGMSLALLCSLTFTSASAATVFTFFFWVLGHFRDEMNFLAVKAGKPAALAGVKVLLLVLPDLSLLNYRDLIDGAAFSPALMGRALLYGVLYTAACLSLSAAIFSRKEF